LKKEKKTGGPGEGFDVVRAGHARVALIGFPSVGKSSFLNVVTNTESEAASYEFTTLTCIPGNLRYNDATIQILDLPGIVEKASQGIGRGKEVIAVARNSDAIIMMVDAVKSDVMVAKLTIELNNCGIRLNQEPADIAFVVKKDGGIKFNSTVSLTHCNERFVKGVCQDYKIHHAEIVFREDATCEQFVDVLIGNRKYLPCLYVHNKIDNTSIEELDRLANQPYSCVISVKKEWNLEFLKEKLWDTLSILRVYTKRKGGSADLAEPVILRKGKNTIKDVCEHIHRDMVKKFKYGRVWGRSSKFCPREQRVGLDHVICDEDIVEVVARN